jgi:hypothetical protein
MILNLRISYRPVRVGWCVRMGDLEDVHRVLRWTHTLWGGRYNPIIPVHATVDGAQLVRRFRVDALFPAANDQALIGFAESFPHLSWPDFRRPTEFFEESGSGKRAPLLDISHPVSRLHREYVKGESAPKMTASLFTWDLKDPLADVFSAQFGSYPSPPEMGVDCAGFVIKQLAGKSIALAASDPLPADAFRAITPSAITRFELEGHNRFGHRSGFYVGDANNFEDIVNFWNLRSANLAVVFFDPAHEERFKAIRDSFVQFLDGNEPELNDTTPPVWVWSVGGNPPINPQEFGKKGFISATAIARFLPSIDFPLMQCKPRWVSPSVSEDRNRTLISVQLPDQPTAQEVEYARQKLVVGVGTGLWLNRESDRTLATPFLPELNEFYRREMLLGSDGVRVQQDGFGIVEDIGSSSVSFFSLHTSQVIGEFFKFFGIRAELSVAGRIAKRVIQQMGGFQGCRPFKFPGVRALIERYGPLESFTRGAATSMIAQVTAPGPINFPRLYAEGGLLTPTSTFDYLLSKRVFRAGLELLCPNCNLEFWLALEPLGHEVTCEYCGEKFNLAAQLKDRDWRFRRSGLFGRENHQEGAIPVALTLQQLDTNLSRVLGFRILSTSFNLFPAGASINSCETDFVVLSQDHEGRIELALGECKSKGPKYEITEDDVGNLSAVANAFPTDRVKVFLIFAKTGDFSVDEIQRCAMLQKSHPNRVIMLSARELEPYHVYERTAQEFNIRPTVISLENLAEATPHIFFWPKVRTKPSAAP